jgi:hypothetical protein
LLRFCASNMCNKFIAIFKIFNFQNLDYKETTQI